MAVNNINKMDQADVDILNKRLIQYFGIDTDSFRPMFRIVWSDDEMEKRQVTHTDEGLELLYPVVKEVPKYRQWCPHKHLIERLVVVPDYQVEELADAKVSYEPLFVFMDKNGDYLPPKWEVCQFVIDAVLTAQSIAKNKGHGNRMVKYKALNREETILQRKARIESIVEYLWGDQSSLMGTTKTGESIIVPGRMVN